MDENNKSATTSESNKSLENSLQLLMQEAANLSLSIPTLTRERNKGFTTDAAICDLAAPLKLPVILRTEFPVVFRRFYDFYFMGHVEQEDTTVCIVFDCISIAKVHGVDLWTENWKGTPGFYRNNTSTSSTLSELTSQHGNIERFRRRINKLLQDCKKDEATTSEIQLLQLTGFLALTLLRFAIKNKNQMKNAFLKTQYKHNLGAATGWTHINDFAPPCASCLSKCENSLNQSMSDVSRMFTVLTAKFIKVSNKTEDPTEGLIAYLTDSVLTDTSYHGLGLIKLVTTASSDIGLTWVAFMNTTSFNYTEIAWKKIVDFFSTQLVKGQEQHGFHWARIIDHGYFRGLSPKDEPFLAMICAKILSQSQGPGIYDTVWAKKFLNTHECATSVGQTILEMYKP